MGQTMAVMPRACASCPAIAYLAWSEIVSPSPRNASAPSARRYSRWKTCMPEPGASASGLGMKLARRPCRSATARMTSRTVSERVGHPQRVGRQQIELFLPGSGFVMGAAHLDPHLGQRGDDVVARPGAESWSGTEVARGVGRGQQPRVIQPEEVVLQLDGDAVIEPGLMRGGDVSLQYRAGIAGEGLPVATTDRAGKRARRPSPEGSMYVTSVPGSGTRKRSSSTSRCPPVTADPSNR